MVTSPETENQPWELLQNTSEAPSSREFDHLALQMGRLIIDDPYSAVTSQCVNSRGPHSPHFRSMLFSIGVPYQLCLNQLHLLPDSLQRKLQERLVLMPPDKPLSTKTAQFANHPEITKRIATLGPYSQEQLGVTRAALGISAQIRYLTQYILFGVPEVYTDPEKQDISWDLNAIRFFNKEGIPPFYFTNGRRIQPKKLHVNVAPEDLFRATLLLTQLWADHTYGIKNYPASSINNKLAPPFFFKVALTNSAYGLTSQDIKNKAHTASGLPPRLVVYGTAGNLAIEEWVPVITQELKGIGIEPDRAYPTRFHKRHVSPSSYLIDVVEGSTAAKGNNRTHQDSFISPASQY